MSKIAYSPDKPNKRTKAKKKAEIESKKEQIRAEDMECNIIMRK